jgi:hypothetical protein
MLVRATRNTSTVMSLQRLPDLAATVYLGMGYVAARLC